AELIPAVPLRDPGGPEDGDPVLYVPEGVEPRVDLVVDPLEPEVVLLLDVARNAEELLVAGQVPPPGFEPGPRGLKGRRSNQLSYRGEAVMVVQESSGRPCSGVDASAWVRRGMRPARRAANPPSTPRRRASAIAAGSSAPKIELAAITASQ